MFKTVGRNMAEKNNSFNIILVVLLVLFVIWIIKPLCEGGERFDLEKPEYTPLRFAGCSGECGGGIIDYDICMAKCGAKGQGGPRCMSRCRARGIPFYKCKLWCK